MMMMKLQTLMTSLRRCFTLHHHHRRRRHRPCQTMLSTVVVTVSIAHRLSAYRLPVLARGRPRFVVVPSSDMVIYVLVIIYVSFRLFSCVSHYLCMRHASCMCYYRTCFYLIRRHISTYVCERHITIISHCYSSYISKETTTDN